MFYYIDTIEQVKGTEDETTVNEYGARTKYTTYDAALTAYYTKLTNVSNDLITDTTSTKSHYYMDIRIVDSTGGVVKRDLLGKLVE